MTPRDRTRTRRRKGTRAAPAAALLASLLAGCASTTPADQVPTAPPTLTQEQQDDQTFEELYAGYIALPFEAETEDDLKPFLTGRALEDDATDIRESRRAGRRITGRDTYSGFRVTDRGMDPDGAEYMTAQMCLDVSGTRVLDAAGDDVTPARDDRLSQQVKAVRTSDGSWRISDFVRNEDVHACD